MSHLKKTFKPLHYWAEEFAIPLYVLSDPKQRPFKNNFLCLQDRDVSRLYFVHGRWQYEKRAGLQYFQKASSLWDYSHNVDSVVRMFQEANRRPRNDLDFMTMIRVFHAWNKVYFTTEAVRLEGFSRKQQEKRTLDFQKIATLRLTLRSQAEKILFPLAEVAVAKLAKQRQMKPNDLFFYTFAEVEQLIRKSKKVADVTLNVRKKGYAFWRLQGKPNLAVGHSYTKVSDWVNTQFQIEGLKELKGRIAHKGLVRGHVQRIIHNASLRSQLKNFKKGNILVTEMTRPETFAICHRASAIVTDEGGLTSHATIIARELNKPCIIGTQIATRVLSDGDLVEVNANTGVVIILKRNSAGKNRRAKFL